MKNGIDYFCYAASGIAGFLVTRKMIGFIGKLFAHHRLMGKTTLECIEKGQVTLKQRLFDTRSEMVAMNLRLKLIEAKVAKLMQDDTITLI